MATTFEGEEKELVIKGARVHNLLTLTANFSHRYNFM